MSGTVKERLRFRHSTQLVILRLSSVMSVALARCLNWSALLPFRTFRFTAPSSGTVLDQCANLDIELSTCFYRAKIKIFRGPRSNFEIGEEVAPLVTQYWEGTKHFFLLILYKFKNIGGGGGGRHVPPAPLLRGPCIWVRCGQSTMSKLGLTIETRCKVIFLLSSQKTDFFEKFTSFVPTTFWIVFKMAFD